MCVLSLPLVWCNSKIVTTLAPKVITTTANFFSSSDQYPTFRLLLVSMIILGISFLRSLLVFSLYSFSCLTAVYAEISTELFNAWALPNNSADLNLHVIY